MAWWTEKEERIVSEGFILASKERVSAASFNMAEVPSLNREGWANSSASDIRWMSEESTSSRAFLQIFSSCVSEYEVSPNQNPDVSETDLSWLNIPTFLELRASNDLSLSQCHLPAESCNLQKMDLPWYPDSWLPLAESILWKLWPRHECDGGFRA